MQNKSLQVIIAWSVFILLSGAVLLAYDKTIAHNIKSNINAKFEKISNIKKLAGADVIQSSSKTLLIGDYSKKGLITPDDKAAYITGLIQKKFKDNSMEIIDLKPYISNGKVKTNLNFIARNANFWVFLNSLADMGIAYNVESVDVVQNKNTIKVKMVLEF